MKLRTDLSLRVVRQRRRRGDSIAVRPLTPVDRDEVVDEVDQDKAGDDGELIDRDHAAADAGGSDLGDIHGRGDRGRADAQAGHHAEDHEPGEIRRKGRAHRRDEEQQGGQHQHAFAAETIAQQAGQTGPQGTAQQRAGRGPPGLEPRIEPEMLLEKADGPGDHGRVVAEQQPAQGGHEGQEDDVSRAAVALLCGGRHARSPDSCLDWAFPMLSAARGA